MIGPNAKQIIQKWSDLGMKARFQHIREASVLGFDVDLYIDLDPTDLPFFLDDLQYMRHHFEVFLTVSLFCLTTEEMERIERFDAYMDKQDAYIAYQNWTHKALQT